MSETGLRNCGAARNCDARALTGLSRSGAARRRAGFLSKAEIAPSERSVMKVFPFRRIRVHAARLLAILLMASFAGAEILPAQQTGPAQQPAVPAPLSPGNSSPNAGSQAGAAQQPDEDQQQREPASAVGTAAAPEAKASGVMSTRPAGAAMAPAKQRRVRSFLIKVGAVVGAAVAVGTVAALSKSSPSRPH